MFIQELESANPNVRLIEPNIERDAQLGVEWLSGEVGKKTLELMGNVPGDIKAPKLEDERARLGDFINKEDELYWMIEVEGKVRGAVWVDLLPKGSVKAPSVHIMIGDQNVRGKGVGTAAFGAVMNWLVNKRGESTIYTRHLKDNIPAYKLVADLGFQKDGVVYIDEDGLEWQNEVFSVDVVKENNKG